MQLEMSKIFENDGDFNDQYNIDIDKQKLNSKNFFIKNNKYKTKIINIFNSINKNYIFIIFLLVISMLLLINIIQIKNLSNKQILFKDKEGSYLNQINKKKEIKICICSLGKKENKYIREFVEFYWKHGVDNIFLYDNNDIGGEKFEEVIKDYIDEGFVKLRNWRGTKKTQFKILDDCYAKNKNNYDWFLIYDIDEYIHLNNYSKIKDFLNEKKFDNCTKIYLNWVVHTDNNQIHYENKSLFERFPEVEKNAKEKNNGVTHRVKCILRGQHPYGNVSCWDLVSDKYKGCNGYGDEAQLINRAYMNNTDFENYYIDHFYSKSLEEFVKKLNKGDNFFRKKLSHRKMRIKRYFKFNKMTLDKIKYIEKHTGIKLDGYKKKLKEKN